jgi:hypothetical protein
MHHVSTFAYMTASPANQRIGFYSFCVNEYLKMRVSDLYELIF